jgi:hypothetical protein
VNGREEGEGHRWFLARGGEGPSGAQLGRGTGWLGRRAAKCSRVGRGWRRETAYGWGPHDGERGRGVRRGWAGWALMGQLGRID